MSIELNRISDDPLIEVEVITCDICNKKIDPTYESYFRKMKFGDTCIDACCRQCINEVIDKHFIDITMMYKDDLKERYWDYLDEDFGVW